MNKKENYGFKLTNSSLLASEYYSKKKREKLVIRKHLKYKLNTPTTLYKKIPKATLEIMFLINK